MMDSVPSPALHATLSAFDFDPAETYSLDKREMIGLDHLQAARTATLRERVLEINAGLNDMSVVDYLKLSSAVPCAEYRARPPFDIRDDDHMRAATHATTKQRALEAAAKASGQSVEEYMEEHLMLTDTHLAPWAR